MIDSNLDYLLNNVHQIYPCIKHPIIDRIVSIADSSHPRQGIFDFNNMLLYGPDSYLSHMYIRYLICRNFKIDRVTLNTVNTITNQCDLTYIESHYFIEINLDTHLNKERAAYVDFIKALVSSCSVLHSKHIVVLLNFDKLNSTIQCKLRRIIEKSQSNALFIVQCRHLNRVIPELQSRFLIIRVPRLERLSGSNFIQHVITQHSNMDQAIDDCQGGVLFDLISNKYSSTDISIYTLYIYAIIYALQERSDTNMEDTLKNDMLAADLETLFEVYRKTKNAITVQSKTREVLYKLLHYSFSTSIIARTTLNILKNKKYMVKKNHSLVHILSKLDHACSQMNPCKVLHCYERYFIDIYCLMNNIALDTSGG